MSNALTPFSFEGTPIRVVMLDEQPRFVVNDVCRVLEISDPRVVVRRITTDYVCQAPVIDSMGRTQRVNAVSEPGLYELIFRSDKPEAARFRRWVFEDVLPAIRRDGGYIRPDATVSQLDALKSRVAEEMEVLALGKGVVDAKWLDARGRDVIEHALKWKTVEVQVPATLDPLNPDEIPDVTAFIGVKPAEWTKRIPGIAPNAKLQKYIVTVLADHAGTRGLAEAMVRHLVTARWYAEGRKPNADAWMDAWHRVTSNPVTCEVGESRWALGRAIGA